MKVASKPFPMSVGVCFILFALLSAVCLMPGAKDSRSPILYVCIFGGLFVGIPAVLGIAVVLENLRTRPSGRR
jgi:hypothetical protein